MKLSEQKLSALRDVTALGSWFFVVLFLALFFFADRPKFWLLLAGMIFIVLAGYGIRVFYFKARPNKEEYGNWFERLDSSSFPSIHAARAAFYALFFNGVFGNVLVLALLVVLGALVCYSRIRLKKHDWSDVAGGIVLGAAAYFLGNGVL